MPWVALTLELDAPQAEAFSDALLEAGAQSVCIEDADAGSGTEVPRYAEPPATGVPQGWPHSRLQALLATHSDPDAVVGAAARAVGMARAPRYRVAQLADEDWVRRTQSEHAPIRIDERLWIVPSWHEPPDPRACNVRIDPGLAFGTGSHPSTRLALRWLARAVPERGRSVLDYGCGSGILAIAAAKLGATLTHAVDSDPLALAATASNARLNGVSVLGLAPQELPALEYDLVVANILANPLIVLAPLLGAHTRPGGHLALSGVLASQAREVIAAYAPEVGLAVADEEDGWVLLAGTRTAAPKPGEAR